MAETMEHRVEQQERRRHRRYGVRLFVDWQVDGTDTTVYSASEDIGPGGLRISTLTPPKAGAEVNVKIRGRMDQKALRVPARVAWVRLDDGYCGMGLSFQPEGDMDSDELETLFRSLSALSLP